MKLFYSPTSPYVRKVMVLLHETGQLQDVTLETASGTPLVPDETLPATNPLAKVPTLERPDGCALYDSRVICRYLDARAGAGLYGGGNALWEVLTLEATAEGIIDAALLMAYEWRLRPEALRYPDWVEGQWSKIDRALAVLNSRWMGHLEGPLNMGQIAAGCALGYLDMRSADRNWRQGHDGLADWYARFSERPSMQATAPPVA